MERTWRWYAVRLELATGVAATIVAAWLVTLAAQPTMGGPTPLLPVAAGAAGCLIGLAWMWRIFRADPEAGAPRRRYRDRR